MPDYGTCIHCGCDTGRQTVRTPIDRSLAFTALLDLYPGFGTMTDAEATPLIGEFLNDWYKSGHTDMYAYAREWSAQDAAKTQPVTGAPLPDVDARRAEVVQMRDRIEQQAAALGIPTDASLGLASDGNADGNPYTPYTPEHRVWAKAQEYGKGQARLMLASADLTQAAYRMLLSRVPEYRSKPGSVSAEPRLWPEGMPHLYNREALLKDAGYVPHDGTLLADDLSSQYEWQARITFWNEVERRCLAALPHREVDNHTQLGNRFITCACGHRVSGGVGDTIAQQNFAHHLKRAREARDATP